MDIIALHAASKPDKVAVIEADRSLTWQQLLEKRNRLANSLYLLGLRPDQHSIVYSLNSLEVILVNAAIRALNGVAVPMNHRLVPEEVSYILDDSDPVCVFVGDDFLPIVDQVRDAATKVNTWITVGSENRDWAEIMTRLIDSGSVDPVPVPELEGLGGSMIYTAGTTGKPKGAIRNSTDPAIAMGWIQELGLMDPNHVHLVAGPLYHSAPAAFATLTQLVGATMVIMRKFNPEEALQLISKHRITTTFMAPTLLKRIVDLPKETKDAYDVSSMQSLIVAGAPCPMKVKEEAIAFFGPVLYEFYGSTELGIDSILKPEDVLRKPGSCGKPPPGIELAVLDDEGNPLPPGEAGELYIKRYAGVFEEYYKKPDATKEVNKGDWLSVGDVAYMDEEGFVYICDRKRDMIISGGVNIYPAEIEDVLHRNDKVQDVAVFGVPDDDWGERVHAAIQSKPGETMTQEEVIAFARQHLAGYKVPREVTFHETFPRDNAGKLLKRVLREPYWVGRTTSV